MNMENSIPQPNIITPKKTTQKEVVMPKTNIPHKIERSDTNRNGTYLFIPTYLPKPYMIANDIIIPATTNASKANAIQATTISKTGMLKAIK